MIKGIIFDLDGVILSTDEFHYLAWKKMADEEGISFSEEDNSRLRGVSRMESLEIILEKSTKTYSPKQKNELAERKNNYYIKSLGELTVSSVNDRTRDALAKLRNQGFKLAIGSSSKNARLILEKVNLMDAFDFISDGNNIKNSKPDPEVFLKAAIGIGLTPADCLIVEDAVSGVEAGIRGEFLVAGMGDASHDLRTHYQIECVADLINTLNFVVFDGLHKYYQKGVHAVDDFSLTVQRKEFIVLVGPSGCGKTTTLRMLAGLEEISNGNLFIDGRYSNGATPRERDIAMVFQSYALYPQMNVYKNIAFALKIKRLSKEEIDKRVLEAAEILEIGELLGRKPRELSGGQRQRVALGRAIVKKARLFLMDEPLSNLDAKLRVQMRSEIIKLHEKINATTIYVTHDQTEAMTMASRIVVMKKGLIQQIGTPVEVYGRPANMFVAGFIGAPSMNFFKATVTKESLNIEPKISVKSGSFHSSVQSFVVNKIHELQKERATLIDLGSESEEIKEKINWINQTIETIRVYEKEKIVQVIAGIRPEHIHVATPESIAKFGKNTIKVTITVAELLGSEYFIHFNLGNQKVIAKVPANSIYESGDEVELVANTSKIHIFDELTEDRID